jgi:hypothetical protein
MINKSAWKILVFAAAVVMLLLRPYIVYQMTSQKALADNPAKAYSLLQRLVKKKDEHHEVPGNTFAETRRFGFSFKPAVKLHQRFYPDLCITMPILRSFKQKPLANTVFRIRPENHRYRFLSCFQV